MGSTSELVRRRLTDQALASPGCSVSSSPQASSCLALRSQGRWEAKQRRIRPARLWVKPRSGGDTGPCKRARRWLGQGRDLLFPTPCSGGRRSPTPTSARGPWPVAQLMDPPTGHTPHPKDARREGTGEGPCIRRPADCQPQPHGSQGPFRTWIRSRPSPTKTLCSPLKAACVS